MNTSESYSRMGDVRHDQPVAPLGLGKVRFHCFYTPSAPLGLEAGAQCDSSEWITSAIEILPASKFQGGALMLLYTCRISIAVTTGFTIAFAIHSVDRSFDPSLFGRLIPSGAIEIWAISRSGSGDPPYRMVLGA